MTLPELFGPSLIGRRDTIALEFEDATCTFGDLDQRSNRVAHWLLARGLKPGDRVCVQLANSVEMIDLYLACIKLGLIFVPINILYKDREITHILHDAEPSLVISSAVPVGQASGLSPRQDEVYW
ncbi:MAG TPA: AMP-binding protein [Blastocatellia bacterium]